MQVDRFGNLPSGRACLDKVFLDRASTFGRAIRNSGAAMIFQSLGEIVRRGWWWLLAVWACLLGGTWWAAPSWDEVAQDREFALLPANVPSQQAEEMFARAFPDDHLNSSIVLVIHRTDGQRGKLKNDLRFIEDVVEPGLQEIAKDMGGLASAPVDEPLFNGDEKPKGPPPQRSIIARIHTPNAPVIGAMLVSEDEQAMLVVVELTTEFLDKGNWPTIRRVEKLVRNLQTEKRLPEGLHIAVTGSSVIGRDHAVAELRSARSTEVLTVVLVVALLLVIYRAPLLALIPLLTVYLAVKLALNCLAILADAGAISLFQGLQIYITILAYGAGVDYSLFLMARYKEELDRGTAVPQAIAGAMKGVGAALSASAATVMFGIFMMFFAEFGKFREAGLAIPFALLLVLTANLTFTPALLRMAGKWAFWPMHPGPAPAGEETAVHRRWWSRLTQGDWLQRVWDRMGHLLHRKPATIWAATIACMIPFAVVAGLNYSRLSYDIIGDLPDDAPSVAGTAVLKEHFPAGIIGPVTLLAVNPAIDFRNAQGRAIIEQVTRRLQDSKDELELADVRSLASPLGSSKAASRAAKSLNVPEDVRRETIDRAALERYVGNLGKRTDTGMRLELILSNGPFARRSVHGLAQLEDTVRMALPADMRDSTMLYVIGTTASVRDLAAVMQADRQRIEILVLVAVLVVLIALLRRVVVSLYLLASVLFSYYTTLGVAFVVFAALDPHGFTGIDWKVAIFLFTILIAVGEDYNILLITRIDEEDRQVGPQHGIIHALARTGPIISTCGIIMAGTFGSLLAGSLLEMKQLGFALAFGILLDTFIVRPVLVPAFLILLRRGKVPLPAWLRKRELRDRTSRRISASGPRE